MHKPVSEVVVKQAVISWLYRHGWGRNMQAKELRQTGVDIRVRHNRYARYFLIEAKGNGKLPQSNEVGFIYSLGQIISRMNVGHARYYYGLALPEPAARIALRRLPWQVAKKLLLFIFSVDDKRKVKRFTWQDLRKAQT